MASDLAELDPADIVRRGVFHVMEGRRVFAHLSVEDNLRAGAFTRPARGVADGPRAVTMRIFHD